MNRNAWATLALASSLFATSGCGTEAGTAATGRDEPEGPCVAADESALRLWGTANFLPSSPGRLAQNSDLVVRATMVDVHPGFDWNDEDSPNPQIILEFRAQEPYVSRSREVNEGDAVYVISDQGPIVVETEKPQYDLDYFRKAIPEGTEAYLFLTDVTPQVASYSRESVETFGRLMFAGIQGIILNDCRGLRGGADDLPEDGEWNEIESAEDLTAFLRR